MGRRELRRKPTKEEKIRRSEPARHHEPGARSGEAGGGQKVGRSNGGRGRIGFEDLSPMTQGIVADIARLQKCTKEEIVEVLNQ